MSEPSLYKNILNCNSITGVNDDTKKISNTIKNAICIDATSIASSIEVGEKEEDIDITSLLSSPISPPYDLCWIEYKSHYGDKVLLNTRYGMLLWSNQEISHIDGQYIIKHRGMQFVGTNKGLAATRTVSFFENKETRCIDFSQIKPSGLCLSTQLYSINEAFDRILNIEADNAFFGCIQCLAWLNAKNIKLRTNDFGRKYQKHARKHLGIDDIKYHTLEIVKPGKQYESVAGYNEKTDTMPLHLCRGHLKRYTEEKPLFGKLSGTFFVPAHVRGNKKNGEIRKDYKLEAKP